MGNHTAFEDTTFLRFLAISIIVNSHLYPFYPIPEFATGGMIGNSIFFMLSSYGLYASEQKNPRGFTEWYARRIKRIYPSVWITVILIILPYRFIQNSLKLEDTLNYLGMFFYPPFWFLKALMIYYFFLFFVIKEKGNTRIGIIVLLFLVLYLIYYATGLDLQQFSLTEFPFRLLFYVFVVLFGVMLSKVDNRINYSGVMDFIGLFFCILIFYFHKFLMTKRFLMELQIIQHIAILPMVFFMIKIARSKMVIEKIMTTRLIAPAITAIAGLSLEIYIVHVSIRPLFIDFDLVYPINILLFVSTSILVAALFKRLALKISDVLR